MWIGFLILSYCYFEEVMYNSSNVVLIYLFDLFDQFFIQVLFFASS